jgi:hypothetical protein
MSLMTLSRATLKKPIKKGHTQNNNTQNLVDFRLCYCYAECLFVERRNAGYYDAAVRISFKQLAHCTSGPNVIKLFASVIDEFT